MAGRRWRLKQKLSFILIQIHSVESSKLIQNVIITIANGAAWSTEF